MAAHILVVDNRESNLDMLRILLEARGYKVTTSDNANDALAFLRANSVDLVVSDINMPDKDGFDFLRALKADPALRNQRFAFLTASFWTNKIKEEGLELGADAFIFRPADPRQLLREVEEALPPELKHTEHPPYL